MGLIIDTSALVTLERRKASMGAALAGLAAEPVALPKEGGGDAATSHPPGAG